MKSEISHAQGHVLCGDSGALIELIPAVADLFDPMPAPGIRRFSSPDFFYFRKQVVVVENADLGDLAQALADKIDREMMEADA